MKSKTLTNQVETLLGYSLLIGGLAGVGLLVIFQGSIVTGLICGSFAVILSIRERRLKQVLLRTMTEDSKR